MKAHGLLLLCLTSLLQDAREHRLAVLVSLAALQIDPICASRLLEENPVVTVVITPDQSLRLDGSTHAIFWLEVSYGADLAIAVSVLEQQILALQPRGVCRIPVHAQLRPCLKPPLVG